MNHSQSSQSSSAARITIHAWLFGGIGLGRLADGRIVMVPGALPHDEIAASALEHRRGVLWADRFELAEGSPMRVDQPCRHADLCGGCQLQMVSREQEIALKENALRDAMARVGGLQGIEIQSRDCPLEESRARGTIHMHEGRMGFYERASHRLLTIRECLVLPPRLREVWSNLSDAVGSLGWHGKMRYAELDKQLLLEVELERGQLQQAAVLSQIAQWVCGLDVRKRGGRRWTHGKTHIVADWLGVQVPLNASAFFQSNPNTWTWFHERVVQFAERVGSGAIWDAHAGSGFLLSALTQRKVIASEPNAQALTRIRQAFGRLPYQVIAVQGTAESLISHEALRSSDLGAMITDPPRGGLSKQLAHWILAHGPRHLLMFSCDAPTLARDIRRLEKSYAIHGPFHIMNVNPGTSRFEVSICLIRR